MKKQWFCLLAALLWMTSLSCGCGIATMQSESIVASSIIDTAHNSRDSLDWKGVYKGTLPCADCEGIAASITLKSDGTFKRVLKYLGKKNNVFFDEGVFVWDDAGATVTLSSSKGETRSYQVGENVLFHLNNEGKRITGDLADLYILVKNRVDPRLEGKKWVLIELRANAIPLQQGAAAAFIRFDMETSMFFGNGSCNQFFGSYELKAGDRISFGNSGATMMACPDMQTERLFLETLGQVDNYSIGANTLSLNKARMAPLARFALAEEPAR